MPGLSVRRRIERGALDRERYSVARGGKLGWMSWDRAGRSVVLGSLRCLGSICGRGLLALMKLLLLLLLLVRLGLGLRLGLGWVVMVVNVMAAGRGG